jgi:hypothetical protein
MKIKETEEKAGYSRRSFIKAAGILGGLAVAGKGITAMAAVPFQENPLVGAIDFHIHSGPDNVARSQNDIQTAAKAKECGMRGIMLYSHQVPTHDRAYTARYVVPGIEVFGMVPLNYPIGGINPAAVEMALKFSGDCLRMVKMPTQSAAHDLAHKAHEEKKEWDGKGLRIYDSSKKVLPEVRQILKMVAKADICMATGHISPEEDIAVIKAAKEEGVRKMVVTHAMNSTQRVSMDIMKQCAEQGAFIEHCFLNLMQKHNTIETYAKAIKELGAEHTVLSTDLGQGLNPLPTDGLKEFIVQLMKQGITRQEIELMTKKNPARLLGLDPF